MPLLASVETFRPPAPRLRVEPLLRLQRYRDPGQVAPDILDAARAMARAGEALVDPSVTFVRRAVARAEVDTLDLAGGPTFHGRCLVTHCGAAGEVVCSVTTIGPALEARVDELWGRGDLLEALFLDTAGWLALELALRAFRAHLAALARRGGGRLGPRLGPGYMDWPLTEQAALFSLFAGAALPVALGEACVMTPRKSLSSLFGLVPGAGGSRAQ